MAKSILIVGTEDYVPTDFLYNLIQRIEKEQNCKITKIITGFHKQLDQSLKTLIQKRKFTFKHIATNWEDCTVNNSMVKEKKDKFGRIFRYNANAYLDRNDKMIEKSDIVVCLNKQYTYDIVKKAKEKGLVVYYEC